jgi:hypothetical protein
MVRAAGRTPARAPGDAAKQVLTAFRKPELVATSLTKLPNILSAEYWLRKADLEEKRGGAKVCGVYLRQQDLGCWQVPWGLTR